MKLRVINLCPTSTPIQTPAFSNYTDTSWGKPRNPSTWQTSENVVFKVTARGYTLHEHIALFDIINMNGRLYDAKLGRMLSPDNYIQAPTSTQSYNRYSYAFNNPLKYVDPDGNWAYEGPHKTGTSYGNWNNFPESGRLFGSYSYDNEWKNMKGPWSIEEMINTQAQSTNDDVNSAATYSNGQMISMIFNYQPRYTDNAKQNNNTSYKINGRDVTVEEFNENILIQIDDENFLTAQEYINTFKSDKGGFIENKFVFILFMRYQAINNPVEVAAYEFLTKSLSISYFIQPWHENTASSNNYEKVSSYSNPIITAQYHTHPSGSAPSGKDAWYSWKYDRPVYTIGPNANSDWRVYVPRSETVRGMMPFVVPGYHYYTVTH